MRVVIGGCGRVGAGLANGFSRAGLEVAVIDRDRCAFERLGDRYTGDTCEGIVFDRETLLAAGIDRADAYVAVTSGDNSNVVSAIVAKEVFRVPSVVARIYEPRRAEIYRRFGIVAVSSVTWATHEITSMILHPGLHEDLAFGDGQVRITSFEVPIRLIGRTAGDLEVPGGLAPVAIVRAGSAMLPQRGTVLESGDIVHIAAVASALPRLEEMIAP